MQLVYFKIAIVFIYEPGVCEWKIPTLPLFSPLILGFCKDLQML